MLRLVGKNGLTVSLFGKVADSQQVEKFRESFRVTSCGVGGDRLGPLTNRQQEPPQGINAVDRRLGPGLELDR